jgi:hypothetical protein
MAEATDVLERQLRVSLYYSPITWNNIRMTFAGETNENHNNGIHDGLSLDRDLNHGSPEYNSGVLATVPGGSVIKALLILGNCIQEYVKRECIYSGGREVGRVAWIYKATGIRIIAVGTVEVIERILTPTLAVDTRSKACTT